MPTDNLPIFPPDHNAPAEWEVLNGLIGRIYDSVLEPQRWNETLAEIAARAEAMAARVEEQLRA